MGRIKRILVLMFRNIYVFRTDYIRVLLISKMMELLIVIPAISILFKFTLEILNVQTITEQNIGSLITHPLMLFVLSIVILIILLFIYYEMGFYMLLAYYQQRQIPYRLTLIWRRLNKKVLYFMSLQSLLFFFYIVLLIPLISSFLPLTITQNIKVPRFIIDELLKSTEGMLLYYAMIVVLFAMSLRLIFTLPFFVVNHWMTVLEAIKESLKFSNKRTLETIAMLLLIFVIYIVSLATVLFIIFIPLFIIDEFLPAYGHVIAAFTLTAAQGVVFIMFGLLQAMFSQVLIFVSFKLTKLKPIPHHNKAFHRGVMQWAYLLAIYAFFLWSGINYLNIAQTIYEPATKIIGHRGYLDKGVENTISSLQEAVKAGSDLVEIDIQQTKDGEFVVFHDKTLRRLAGRSENVYNMTLEELMDITVYSNGNSDKIPSLDQMLEESQNLKVELLIEVKTHGYETDDFIERLVTKLDEYNSIDIHYIQSLEYPLAVAIHEYEPRLKVGSVHAVAIGSLPNYGLDFVAIEQSFVTRNIIFQAKNQDIEIFVWTVNTIGAIQHYLIENVDGIITNYPDISYILRDELEENKHFLRRVWNKITIIF